MTGSFRDLRRATALALLLAAVTAAESPAVGLEPRTLATGVDNVTGVASATSGLLAWNGPTPDDGLPGAATVRPDGMATTEPITGARPGDLVAEVALSQRGAAALCLLRYTGTNSINWSVELLVAIRPPGSSFGEPRRVDSSPGGYTDLDCAIGDDGTMAFAWLDELGIGQYAARAATLDGAGRFAARTLVPESAWDVSLSLSPDGRAAVGAVAEPVFRRQDVVLARQRADGTIGPARRVTSVGGDTSVSVLQEHKLRLLWSSNRHLHRADGSTRRAVRTPSKPWQPATVWAAGGVSLTTWLDEPRTATNPRRARTAFLRPGRRARFAVLGPSAGNWGPFPALGPDGSGVVAWQTREEEVAARTISRSGTPGPLTPLGTLGVDPSVATLAWSAGRSLVAWVTRDGELRVRRPKLP